MKAFAIVIKGNDVSESGFKRLLESSKRAENSFEIERFDAIVPPDVDRLMEEHHLEWTWPWDRARFDEKSQIRMHPYGNRNPKRRIACFLSHYLLWLKCSAINEPILILEHDAEFIKQFDPKHALASHYGAIGINDPRGATRRANVFHDIVQAAKEEVLPCPIIDKMEIAQGLAGASAYVIKPETAYNVRYACKEYGCWPNDAILCQQIIPNQLGVTKKYYTKVQGLFSTTTSLD